eukprot:CAMPEP_0201574388 /NCGR_PEP_ID=MMETSP0190_2-20130828/18846_1 /ASSEMBLY_ACC=CAM_ASM_000263 /TAXON_ID=37353 /ORGANISM="Rosalina sp." /LENGTH=41 /DNA_ID= /DNA_START= /DNA_END= /DNA_ORIENTATION=
MVNIRDMMNTTDTMTMNMKRINMKMIWLDMMNVIGIQKQIK